MTTPGCATCKHHSAKVRARVLAADDPEQVGLDFDQIATSDTETETEFWCRNERMYGKTGLYLSTSPRAAADCEGYTEGTKGAALSDQLRKSLARFDG